MSGPLSLWSKADSTSGGGGGIRVTLGFYWGYTGVILGLYWAYTGDSGES